MDKSIQGKSPKDIFFELSGILKLEDYKFKEDTTHQAYLPNGKLFDVTKECNQVVVSALVRTTIKYDNGGHFSHYKKF